jgi:predicted RNA-binding Zn ribbon-like protein
VTEHRVFELIAGDPILDLVNTLDWRFRESSPEKPSPEELLTSYRDLLDFAVQAGLLTAAQRRHIESGITPKAADRALSACLELREAAAAVFYAVLAGESPAQAQIAVLEEFFNWARRHRRAVWTGSRLDYQWDAEESAKLPVWMLTLGAERLLTSDEMLLLRECGNPECRWLFLDTSKNHTRRWCDMKICGNRIKARRFKAQQRALQSTPLD